MTFHEAADFCVARSEGVDCTAGETTAFWVNLRLPAGAPGVYAGTLTAQPNRAPLPCRLAGRSCRSVWRSYDRTRCLALDEGLEYDER